MQKNAKMKNNIGLESVPDRKLMQIGDDNFDLIKSYKQDYRDEKITFNEAWKLNEDLLTKLYETGLITLWEYETFSYMFPLRLIEIDNEKRGLH